MVIIYFQLYNYPSMYNFYWRSNTCLVNGQQNYGRGDLHEMGVLNLKSSKYFLYTNIG